MTNTLDKSLLSDEDAKKYLDTIGNPIWRLHNLYQIKDKSGKKVTFKPNWAQWQLYDKENRRPVHNLNVILKARQLGITTWHAILFLDYCIWNENIHAAFIADSKTVARDIFQDKVKFAYDNLPEFVKMMCPAYRDNMNEMRFSNGSVFRVSTSLRGGTVQFLHITEFAKICQENPYKAAEIMTGALNTVQAGQFICIESTARGRDGFFYDICKEAERQEIEGEELGPLDYKFWFFPWHKDTSYTIDTPTTITKEMKEYFDKLSLEGIDLTDGQKWWYIKKLNTQHEYMLREFPGTPREAFESINEGLYFGKHIVEARHEHRICHLPYDEHAKCFTCWDIGWNDETSIWVFQLIGKEIHWIDHYENSGEPLAHYVNWLRSKPYTYERHFLPFDAESKNAATGKGYADYAREMGLKVGIVERISNELFGIENARNMFSRMFFDKTNCAQGIKCLENFRKEWNEKLGCYRERSLHDWASHSSKALIYGCQAIEKTSGSKGLTAQQWAALRNEVI